MSTIAKVTIKAKDVKVRKNFAKPSRAHEKRKYTRNVKHKGTISY